MGGTGSVPAFGQPVSEGGRQGAETQRRKEDLGGIELSELNVRPHPSPLPQERGRGIQHRHGDGSIQGLRLGLAASFRVPR